MPELVPMWNRLSELVGGGDHEARMLSLYRPTPYMSGCSQAVWTRADGPLLARNYDYHPTFCEGTILLSKRHGVRTIVQSDCLWGALDGMNEHGLVVSLAFGGSQAVGDGFGIPLVLRYILEFCTNVDEARAVLLRVPSHMAYNVMAVDLSGRFINAHVYPGRKTIFANGAAATTISARSNGLGTRNLPAVLNVSSSSTTSSNWPRRAEGGLPTAFSNHLCTTRVGRRASALYTPPSTTLWSVAWNTGGPLTPGS